MITKHYHFVHLHQKPLVNHLQKKPLVNHLQINRGLSSNTNSQSSPDIVVKAESAWSFVGRSDWFWNDREVKYNWKADIKATRSRISLH